MKKELIQLTLDSLDFALQAGADDARICTSVSTEDLVSTLDGEIDKVTGCADSSMNISIFVDGRFGAFSTNRLDADSLKDFIAEAVRTARMLAPDPCRCLPDPSRYCTAAVTGNELDTCDPAYRDLSPEHRTASALAASVKKEGREYGACRLISEEGEYSDSLNEIFLADTRGLRCLHSETNYDYGVEVTVEDADGAKYSDYWWESSAKLDSFDPSSCGRIAVERAVAQIGSKPCRSGRYNMVVASEAASKMVSPILNALNGYSIQQGNSFLCDCLGKKVFSEGLTIVDLPHVMGQSCSKLFDSEGVATEPRTVIDRGVVNMYFINTFISAKLDMPPTAEEAVRPKLESWPSPGLDRDAIMAMCGDGILVTEFNGGNSNSATGDFSYGITGQCFRKGKPAGPVSEMLVTGNFIDLWNRLIAVGDDFRPCMSKLIPTLAFSKVDFNGQ